MVQTIGFDPFNGLTVYHDGIPVAQVKDTTELFRIAQECLRIIAERRDDD
jgi:hypothetical protein